MGYDMGVETTRHFTATVYVVEGGAVALHEHDRLGIWLPPGGHLDRDELPHEAARREVHEETGLDVELVADRDDPAEVGSSTVDPLPQPRHVQLADVNACDGVAGHQHVDLIYYARAPTRRIDPGPGEASAEEWAWVDRGGLAEERFDPDVRAIGRRAIAAVGD